MKTFYLKYLIPSIKKNNGFKELLVFLSFLVFYKISRFIAIGDELTAFNNAYRLINVEVIMGIFYEINIQHFFADYTFLIKILNKFYMLAHLPVTILFFVWVYHKRHNHYKFIRNGFLIANSLTIFFYVNYPCAPPRMLGNVGFVDTLLTVSNVNLYTGMFSGLFNQYAAVPSMHFGNALLIGIVFFLLIKNKLVSWLFLIYPIFVLLVIVVTGNHFFLDAIIGGIVVIIPYPILLLAKKVNISKNYSSRTLSLLLLKRHHD
ncbi:MAG: phosphatase PAP2 family protein [Vicingaceae bacterium]|nr:phosphatase PAP2 family protein [Vicingaceae bacterium]